MWQLPETQCRSHERKWSFMSIPWSAISHDPYFSELPVDDHEGVVGRIAAQDGPLPLVVSAEGTRYARPSGRLDYMIDLGTAPVPAVGDYVLLEPGPDGRIHTVLPRRSVFERKEAGDRRSESQVICANVDVALIVTTAPQAAASDDSDRTALHDFSTRRIERFITTLDSRVRPIVVVNKCDLVRDHEQVRRAVTAELPGAEVVLISALTGEGVDALRGHVPAGATAVLVGSSGSGKTTLVSLLTGVCARTGGLRERDGRGRHTTTSRRIYPLAGGGLLVDTPGMREVQLWSNESADEQLASAFPEIDEIALHCRFNDCRHGDEPGCAVREAVRDGRVTQERYLSYLELHAEQDIIAARREKRDRLNARRTARKARTRRRSRADE